MISRLSNISLMIVMTFVLMMAAAVEAAAKDADDARLMEGIRKHVEQNMIWTADSMRIEFLSAIPKMDDLKGKITYNIESRPREEYIGDTSLAVRIFANNIFVREENVRLRIEVLREFVVSVNTINRDSILQASDVTVQKKWVRHIPMNAVSTLDEALGKHLAMRIRPNTMITRAMLKDVMPVKKGKMVQVILDNGVLKMMMSGVAEEDGADDALIRVRNLSSNKVIYGRVIGRSKVQVDF